MPRANITQQNFTSGELSPKMYGRYDLQAYYNGCERMENFIPQVQGPARFRNGTMYSTTTVNGDEPTFIPFVFNEDDAYLLEFTENRLRFFRNQAPLLFVLNASIKALERRTNQVVIHVDATNTTTTFHTQNTVDFRNIELAQFGFLNHKSWEVAAVNTSTFNPAYIELVITKSLVVAAAAIAVTSGGADSHVTVTTNFSATDLTTLKYKQTYDAMYLVDGNEVVYALTRLGSVTWTLAAHATTWITFNTANNYPHTVEIYEDRLILANTDTDPFKIWLSVSGDYTDFTTGVADTDAFLSVIADSQNDILHTVSYNKFLMVLTGSGAYKMFGADENTAITPTNRNIRPIHYIGSSKVTPVQKDNDLIFVENGDVKLRQVEYSFQRDRYEPKDLTKIAEHIAGTGFQKITYQRGKVDTVWCKANDGNLVGLTYDQGENVLAWHRHFLGNDPTNHRATQFGEIIDVKSLPKSTGADDIWIAAAQGNEVNIAFMQEPEVFPVWEDFYTGDFDADRKRFLGELFYSQQRSLHLDAARIYNGSYGITQNLTLGAVTGTGITVTASASLFTSDMVGREIWGQTSAKSSQIQSIIDSIPYGKAIIRSYVSTTEVTVDIYEDFEKDSLSLAGSTFTPSDEAEWYITTNTIVGLGHLVNKTVSIIADG